jgi:hypothetical protein
MKKFLVSLFTVCCLGLASGCSSITIDGQVDVVEQSLIDIAVSSALALYPDAAPIAHIVSGDILALSGDETVELGVLGTIISAKIDALDITDAQKTLATNLYNFVKTSLMAKLESLGIEDSAGQFVVVSAVAQSVYDAS